MYVWVVIFLCLFCQGRTAPPTQLHIDDFVALHGDDNTFYATFKYLGEVHTSVSYLHLRIDFHHPAQNHTWIMEKELEGLRKKFSNLANYHEEMFARLDNPDQDPVDHYNYGDRILAHLRERTQGSRHLYEQAAERYQRAMALLERRGVGRDRRQLIAGALALGAIWAIGSSFFSHHDEEARSMITQLDHKIEVVADTFGKEIDAVVARADAQMMFWQAEQGINEAYRQAATTLDKGREALTALLTGQVSPELITPRTLRRLEAEVDKRETLSHTRSVLQHDQELFALPVTWAVAADKLTVIFHIPVEPAAVNTRRRLYQLEGAVASAPPHLVRIEAEETLLSVSEEGGYHSPHGASDFLNCRHIRQVRFCGDGGVVHSRPTSCIAALFYRKTSEAFEYCGIRHQTHRQDALKLNQTAFLVKGGLSLTETCPGRMDMRTFTTTGVTEVIHLQPGCAVVGETFHARSPMKPVYGTVDLKLEILPGFGESDLHLSNDMLLEDSQTRSFQAKLHRWAQKRYHQAGVGEGLQQHVYATSGATVGIGLALAALGIWICCLKSKAAERLAQPPILAVTAGAIEGPRTRRSFWKRRRTTTADTPRESFQNFSRSEDEKVGERQRAPSMNSLLKAVPAILTRKVATDSKEKTAAEAASAAANMEISKEEDECRHAKHRQETNYRDSHPSYHINVSGAEPYNS